MNTIKILYVALEGQASKEVSNVGKKMQEISEGSLLIYIYKETRTNPNGNLVNGLLFRGWKNDCGTFFFFIKKDKVSSRERI